jgi:hypothetical protein
MKAGRKKKIKQMNEAEVEKTRGRKEEVYCGY